MAVMHEHARTSRYQRDADRHRRQDSVLQSYASHLQTAFFPHSPFHWLVQLMMQPQDQPPHDIRSLTVSPRCRCFGLLPYGEAAASAGGRLKYE